MELFRILYFKDSVLQEAHEVRVRDVLDAIEHASAKPPHIRAEVWTEDRRVAEVGTSPDEQ